jgi:hypothetical protein
MTFSRRFLRDTERQQGPFAGPDERTFPPALCAALEMRQRQPPDDDKREHEQPAVARVSAEAALPRATQDR